MLARGSEQKSLLFASSPGHSDLLGLVSWDGGGRGNRTRHSLDFES